MGKSLMLIGLTLFLLGAFWHWGARFGLGSLPGDFTWKKGSFTFFAPLGTSLILSLVLSLILWLIQKSR